MIRHHKDGTVSFGCSRCRAVAAGPDKMPLVFATIDELAIVAQRDGWLDQGEHPDRNFIICPPCRLEMAWPKKK